MSGPNCAADIRSIPGRNVRRKQNRQRARKPAGSNNFRDWRKTVLPCAEAVKTRNEASPLPRRPTCFILHAVGPPSCGESTAKGRFLEDKISGNRAIEKKALMHEMPRKSSGSNICHEYLGLVETIGAIMTVKRQYCDSQISHGAARANCRARWSLQ